MSNNQPRQQLEQYNSFMKVIETLSLKINEKTKELDDYKLNYTRKITRVDELIRQISKVGKFKEETSITRQEDLVLHKGEEQDIWKDNNGDVFLVIPLTKDENEEETELVTDELKDIKLDNIQKPKQQRKKKKKQNCSYCHEIGHNRASCPKKLYVLSSSSNEASLTLK